jgi:hypothetical protein
MLDAAAFELNKSYTKKAKSEGNGSYHDWAQCRSNAVLQNLPNSYTAMAAMHKHLSEVNTMSLNADKEKINLDEFNTKVDTLIANFSGEEAKILQADRARKSEAWSRAAQQFSAAQQQKNQQMLIQQQQMMQNRVIYQPVQPVIAPSIPLNINSCNSSSFAPFPKFGCKKVCINGKWADVC